MASVQEKIAQAKAAGYSDAEIASHLAATPEYGDKIKAASTAGYKPEEIVSHLVGDPAQRAESTTGPAGKQAPGKSGGIIDGAIALVGGIGKGVGGLALGAQRLAGKGLVGLDSLAQDYKGSAPTLSDLVAGKKTQPNSLLNRAGAWLVNDAESGRAKLAAEIAPYKDSNPLMTAAGQIGGEILGTLPLGGVALKGGNALAKLAGASGSAGKIVGALPRAAQAAGVGAAYGGALGAAQSNADTLGGTLADSAKGAATSAVMGGIASPLTSALGAVAGNVKQRFSESSAAEFAKQKIAEAFARDARGSLATGGYINPIGQIAARFGKLGDEAVMADAGGLNTNQLLDTLAVLPGRTKEAVYNVQRQRTAGVGSRMRDSAERALDTQGQRLPATVDSLILRRQTDSAPFYNQLRQTDIAPTPELVELMKNARELGVTKLAKEIATARQQPYTLDTAPPGAWNMGDLDLVKQGVDQVLSSRKAQLADGTMTSLGTAYQKFKNNLVQKLDEATLNPQTGESLYRSARKAYEDPTRLKEAAEAGKLAINRDEASINSVMRQMSDTELQAFRIGAFEGLRNKLGTKGGQTNIMNMWAEPSTQEKLKAVFGSQRAYREFAADVAKEAQLKRIQSVGVGSQTAARQAAMGDLDLHAMSDVAGAAAAAKAGNPLVAIGAAKNAWNRVAIPEPVRNQMGAMLLSRGSESQQNMNALVKLVQQINDRNLMLSGRVGTLSGQAGGNFAGSMSNPVHIQQQ